MHWGVWWGSVQDPSGGVGVHGIVLPKKICLLKEFIRGPMRPEGYVKGVLWGSNWRSIVTMIGNGKFEPLTLWNDIELRYRITASQ